MTSLPKYRFVQLEELVGEIDKLDQLIDIHRGVGHAVEVKQYESRKLKCFKEILNLLIDSSIDASEPQMFHYVHRLIERFYPASVLQAPKSSDAQLLGNALMPFLGIPNTASQVAEPTVTTFQKK
ncbi:MAG: hypothetical protein KAX50_10140 [Saprospiraceae bacterium]|jgi:hypothetical protein|nr:hypothetical protein [Saprospiraceae bacterium]